MELADEMLVDCTCKLSRVEVEMADAGDADEAALLSTVFDELRESSSCKDRAARRDEVDDEVKLECGSEDGVPLLPLCATRCLTRCSDVGCCVSLSASSGGGTEKELEGEGEACETMVEKEAGVGLG